MEPFKKIGKENTSFYKIKGFEICRSGYRKVAKSNTSSLEAHAGFFRLFMKGICSVTFWKKVDFLISNVC